MLFLRVASSSCWFAHACGVAHQCVRICTGPFVPGSDERLRRKAEHLSKERALYEWERHCCDQSLAVCALPMSPVSGPGFAYSKEAAHVELVVRRVSFNSNDDMLATYLWRLLDSIRRKQVAPAIMNCVCVGIRCKICITNSVARVWVSHCAWEVIAAARTFDAAFPRGFIVPLKKLG